MARKRGVFFDNSQCFLKIGSSLVLAGRLGALAVGIAFSGNYAFAQITPDGTLGAESSVVTPNVKINSISADRIDGGATRGSNLFHSFLQLNVGEGGRVYFANPTGIQNIFGRITGSDPSDILGTLGVDGSANLFLLNPNGIIFGPNAKLDIRGSFFASTASNIAFPNGYQFSATNPKAPSILSYNVPIGLQYGMNQPAAIVNAGNLAVGEGQNLSLIGGTVVSTGTLEALEGNITVASVPGSSRMRLSQTGQISNLEIEPHTKGQGSLLSIRPLTLPQLLTNGNVSSDIGVTVNPDGTGRHTESGINFPTEAGTSIIAGRLNVSGKTGGAVNALGDKVGLINVNINASGTKGGGTVLIGGDYQGQGMVLNASRTFVSSNSVINADALLNGNGGRVIIWADDTAGFYGNISAKGGLNWGNGGFVEVSGKQDLVFLGNVDLSTPNGKLGTLLLDPTNILIVAGAAGTGANDAELADGSILFTDSPTVPFTISQGTLQSQLGAVTLQAANDITITPGVSLNFVGGGGAIAFTADADNDGVGSFSMNSGDTITAPGRVITISGASITVGTISTSSSTGNAGSITLDAKGDISTGQVNTTVVQSKNGNGGNITLNAGGRITVMGNMVAFSVVNNGGNIILAAKDNIFIDCTGPSACIESFSSGDSSLSAIGNSGDISLISKEGGITVRGSSLNAYNPGSGTPGNITLSAYNNINISGLDTSTDLPGVASGTISVTSTAGAIYNETGIIYTNSVADKGGTIILKAAQDIITGNIDSTGQLGGGTVNLVSSNGSIDTTKGILNSSSTNGNGGAITLNTTAGSIITGDINSSGQLGGGNINLTSDRGRIDTRAGTLNSFSVGSNGGNILLDASGNVTTANIFSDTAGGDAGRIILTSRNGAIDTTAGSLNAKGTPGDGNTITLNAQENINTGRIITDGFAGGNIGITSYNGSVNVSSLESRSSGTTVNGNGGAVDVSANRDITIDNIVATGFNNGGNVSLDSSSGTISISTGIDTSSTGSGGSIFLTSDNSTVTVGTLNSSSALGNGGAITLNAVSIITKSDIKASGGQLGGDINLASSSGNLDTSAGTLDSSSANGNGGAIALNTPSNITTGNIDSSGQLSGGNIGINSSNSTIDTTAGALNSSSANGNGGEIALNTPSNITTGNINSSGQLNGGNIGINSSNGSIDTTAGALNSSSANGNGGDIALDTPSNITTGNIDSSGQLSGGNIGLNSSSGNLDTSAGTVDSSSTNGNGGAIAFNTTTGNIIAGDVRSTSLLNSGDISFSNTLGTISLTGAINSSAATGNFGNGGDITITTRRFELQGGATVSANTNGAGTGQAGKFTINASESFEMSGASTLSFTSFSADGTGDFSITTPKLSLRDGARISANTFGTQQAGNFIVTAPESVEASGISAIDGSPGGLFFETISAGNAGEFRIDTGRLAVQEGAQISNITRGVGEKGTLAVTANSMEVSGSSSGLFFNMRGSGDASGLRIDMKTGPLTVRDGAQVSVSGKGSGSAGDLTISAESLFMDNQGRLTATTDSGQGGNISLKVANSIILRNDSDIRSNAFGTGNGGNINIDAGGFVLAILSENSDIIATAIQGRGGSINAAADEIFGFRLYQNVDTPESDFTASSEFGIDGTVAINTLEKPQPNALPDDFLEDDIAQSCQPSSGKLTSSEYVETGRGGLASNPNSALGSNAGWVDFRPATPVAENRSSSATNTPLTDSTPDQIVEAQGWAYNTQGELEFTDSTSSVVPYSSWFTPSACNKLNNPAQK